jgi:hypothetical protein
MGATTHAGQGQNRADPYLPTCSIVLLCGGASGRISPASDGDPFKHGRADFFCIRSFWSGPELSVDERGLPRKIFADTSAIARFEPELQILILLPDSRVAPQEIAKPAHSLNLPVTTDTYMDLVRSYPVDIATIEMVPC